MFDVRGLRSVTLSVIGMPDSCGQSNLSAQEEHSQINALVNNCLCWQIASAMGTGFAMTILRLAEN